MAALICIMHKLSITIEAFLEQWQIKEYVSPLVKKLKKD